MNKIVVRFAPSPTGPLHIGGARSALFNYLFAAHQGGKMVLRIEDTDLERSRREYEDEIIESLHWLGLEWEEGIDIPGENGPYRQTERLEIYQKYTRQLLESGQAYYCFCTEEELEEERKNLLASGEMQKYSGKCRDLSAAEKKAKLAQGIKPAVRFRIPPCEEYIVDDLVRGKVSFASEDIGDFIIVKSDGIPTYNFAVVIDDVLMGISHVIRAEEHLSNTPRQLALYDALKLNRPQFAHISLILGSDRQKMSKRHGATSLIQYRRMGYLPEALFNFLSLMGWSPEGEEEILLPAEIIAAFTLDRVAKNPAVFDLDKLNWLNQQYIKKLGIQELAVMVKPYLEDSNWKEQLKELEDYRYELMVLAVRDHLVALSDIRQEAEVFLGELTYENEAKQLLNEEGVLAVLEAFRDGLRESMQADEVKAYLKGLTKELKLKPKNVFMPVRCALSGRSHGPDLPLMVTFWGYKELLRRLEQSINMIKQSH
ncbi:MAG: glutamate--tRNA ligase [Syntrophomonadaceae bacterium]|nr:glutamate--tRNA ligase [Syntrophomonadaceae bacterium]MDD3022718.1 glutamate--tRNA ligase [Syntrophomonadaceae bacterium]